MSAQKCHPFYLWIQPRRFSDLFCGSVGKFQLKRVKQGQRPLRHLTPLKRYRSERNPLSSIREVYIHTRTNTFKALQWFVVTLTIKFHYSDTPFIHNASNKLPRENTVSYLTMICVAAEKTPGGRRLGADLLELCFYKPTVNITAYIPWSRSQFALEINSTCFFFVHEG